MATSKSVDLAKVFGTVAKTLAENRESLNSADDYNHNHGDNMVQTFDMITRAIERKETSFPCRTIGVCCSITQAAIQQWFSPTLC